jgi:SAM-dependent methyltransferase
MSEYDRDFWEERWSQALREHGDRVAQRPPNAHLTAEVGDLRPGRALDAGCGHGSDTLWLAARGWQVTAVDFAATALAYARSTAEAMGPDVAERVDWGKADLAHLDASARRVRPGGLPVWPRHRPAYRSPGPIATRVKASGRSPAARQSCARGLT